MGKKSNNILEARQLKKAGLLLSQTRESLTLSRCGSQAGASAWGRTSATGSPRSL